MAIFDQKQTYLGVDIGSSGIKIVELASKNKKPVLQNYGFHEQQIVESVSNRPEPEQLSAVIREIIKRTGMGTENVVASLPSFSVFSSIITLPKMSIKELGSAVQYEAKKVIPLPLEETVLDWKVLEPDKQASEKKKGAESKGVIRQKPQENLRILLTAAPKDLVTRYVKIFKDAGLNLSILETEVFALAHSLVGNDPSIIMLVDVGSLTTNISIIDRGIPVLNRSIDVAGRQMSMAISKTTGLSIENAEVVKQDFVYDESMTKIPDVILKSMDPILNEIRYILNLYESESEKLTLSDNDGKRKIEKIILTGGASYLSGLPEYLSSSLNLQTFLGDPWARVSYPEEISPLLNDIGSQFSIALGCAMRNIIE